MGYFFLMGMLALLTVGAYFGGKVAKSENPQGAGGLFSGAALVIGVLLMVVFTLFRAGHTVENGHIGIVKQFGSIVDTTGEGLVWTMPWQSLDQVSIRNEIRNYVMDERREQGTGSAVTSDTQPVFIDLVLNYSLVRAGAVPLYRETGGQYVERIIDPAVYQVTKEVTAQYKAIEFAANREKIRREIQEALDEEVSQVRTDEGQMLEAININSVSLKNVDFTDALTKAIEETVEAEQQAKRSQAQVAIAEAEADKVAAAADGEARANIARAEGEAKAVLAKAQAEAKRINLEGNALRNNPQLLQLRAIEKLNPQVQLIVPEDSTLVQGIDGTVVPTK